MMEKSKLQEKICRGDEQAYQCLFRLFYADLVVFANGILRNLEESEDVVQEFFINFWCEKKYRQVHTSLENYMFRAVKNACLNYLRREKYRTEKLGEIAGDQTEEEHPEREETGEREEVYKAISQLPEQCKRIFTLCCVEGKKYQETADELHISINTVRTQMGRAFKTLREKLAGKASSLLLYLGFLQNKR